MRKLLRSIDAFLLRVRAARAEARRPRVVRVLPPADHPILVEAHVTQVEVVVMAEERVVPLLPRPSLDGLEYAARLLMAELAALPPARGFDTALERAKKGREIDHALDLYNLAASAFDDNEELIP